MSSGFVSGGTVDDSTGEEVPTSIATKTNDTSDEWAKAQQDIEKARRRKAEAGRQEPGKSLFEVLEANKARKQEAFEESIRLKNQFRSLDEDEIEFLDSVLESTRAREAALKKETAEQLEIFRKHQEEADKAAFLEGGEAGEAPAAAAGGRSGSPVVEEEQWAVGGRKRKKGREKEGLKGVKIRRTSSISEKTTAAATFEVSSNASLPSKPPQLEVKDAKSSPAQSKLTVHTGPPSPTVKKALPMAPTRLQAESPTPLVGRPAGGGLLGLDYGSDDDDD